MNKLSFACLVTTFIAIGTLGFAQNKKTPAKPVDSTPPKTEQPAAAPALK
jgi:hypothetical protein